jgi:Flp pilus assembly protein TadD
VYLTVPSRLLGPLSKWTERDFTAHYDETLAQLRRAAKIRPDEAETHHKLGIVLELRGRSDEAIAEYRQALEIKPLFVTHYNLGVVLQARGRTDEAIVQYRHALELQPDNADTRCDLGSALGDCGRFDEAIAQFKQALQIQPDNVGAQKNLAWLRATCPIALQRNGEEAAKLAERANRRCDGKRPDVLDTLAAAYAELGWFQEALAVESKALKLATQQHDEPLADELRSRITLYEGGKPYRQKLPAPALPPKP